MNPPSAKPEELQNEIQRLNYIINYLRLPLAIDPSVSNKDTEAILAEFHRAFNDMAAKYGRLHDWEQVFEAALCRPATPIKLWPNKWHQDAAAVAFLIRNLEQDNGKLQSAAKAAAEKELKRS